MTDDHPQTTNDRGCSQQVRSNQTLGEKLDQTTGTICPPEKIDPPFEGTTPPNSKAVLPSPETQQADQPVQPR